MTTQSWDRPVSLDQDMAGMLANLPLAGATDTAARVMAVYYEIMKVYGPTQRRYEAAVQAMQTTAWPNGFATGTNP